MRARHRRGSSAALSALVLACAGLALAGCERPGANDGDLPAQVAAALDPCAAGAEGLAQSICNNEKLAALNGEVREALVAEAASVSSEGAQMLIDTQQRWLETQRIACGVIDAEAAPSADQQSCLEGKLRDRAREAATAVEQIGGYTFQRVEVSSATAMTAEIASSSGLGESAPPAIVTDVRYPRIDGEQTPQVQRFNQLVAQQPRFRLEDATEEQVGYQIAFAGPELISVRFDLYEYSLGAAHPDNSSKAVTVVMATGEPLKAADVFKAGSGWEDFLTRRSMAAIIREFRDYSFDPPERDVRESATKPHLWLITEQGLVIIFPPYSFGGPHALGGAQVEISWADLRAYLNPQAPAPIGAGA